MPFFSILTKIEEEIINKNMKKVIITSVSVIAFLLIGFFVIKNYTNNPKQGYDENIVVNSYEECVAAGFPILESYPEQCVSADGRHFTRKLKAEELAQMAVPAILYGSFVCLPLRNPSDSLATSECVYGIKAESGEYYTLKDDSSSLFSVANGQQIEIRGMLNPEKSEIYQSEGVIDVQEFYVIKTEKEEEEKEEITEDEPIRLETDSFSFIIPRVSFDYTSIRDWQVDLIRDEEVLLERVFDGQLVCREIVSHNDSSLNVSRVITDKAQYCLETISEGAAGSVYTKYSYYTLNEDDLIVIKFTAQYPQCYNYDDPEKTDCLAERESFSTNDIADEIFSSLIKVEAEIEEENEEELPINNEE